MHYSNLMKMAEKLIGQDLKKYLQEETKIKDKSMIATELGISRPTLYNWMEKLNI